jgi:hypothetical protein
MKYISNYIRLNLKLNSYKNIFSLTLILVTENTMNLLCFILIKKGIFKKRLIKLIKMI